MAANPAREGASLPPRKVAIGSKELAIDGVPKDTGEFKYEVKVQVPKTAPDSDEQYAPILVMGKSKQRIPSKANVILKYPSP